MIYKKKEKKNKDMISVVHVYGITIMLFINLRESGERTLAPFLNFKITSKSYSIH